MPESARPDAVWALRPSGAGAGIWNGERHRARATRDVAADLWCVSPHWAGVGGEVTATDEAADALTRQPSLIDPHSCVGVEEPKLVVGCDVADNEGSLADAPEALALLQFGKLGVLSAGEAEFPGGVR